MTTPIEAPRGDGMKAVEPQDYEVGFKRVAWIPATLLLEGKKFGGPWRMEPIPRTKKTRVVNQYTSEEIYIGTDVSECRLICERLNGYEVAREFPVAKHPVKA